MTEYTPHYGTAKRYELGNSPGTALGNEPATTQRFRLHAINGNGKKVSPHCRCTCTERLHPEAMSVLARYRSAGAVAIHVDILNDPDGSWSPYDLVRADH